MLLFGSILKTFEASNIFVGGWVSGKNGSSPKPISNAKVMVAKQLHTLYQKLKPSFSVQFIKQFCMTKQSHFSSLTIFQVTETIPKAMFEQANCLRKTVYQKATQVPRVGNNSIYIAVNPTQKMQQQPQQQQQPQRTQSASTASSQQPKSFSSPASNANSASSSSSSDQVSILVRPHKGGKQVLLNVPRKIALKVKADSM